MSEMHTPPAYVIDTKIPAPSLNEMIRQEQEKQSEKNFSEAISDEVILIVTNESPELIMESEEVVNHETGLVIRDVTIDGAKFFDVLSKKYSASDLAHFFILTDEGTLAYPDGLKMTVEVGGTVDEGKKSYKVQKIAFSIEHVTTEIVAQSVPAGGIQYAKNDENNRSRRIFQLEVDSNDNQMDRIFYIFNDKDGFGFYAIGGKNANSESETRIFEPVKDGKISNGPQVPADKELRGKYPIFDYTDLIWADQYQAIQEGIIVKLQEED